MMRWVMLVAGACMGCAGGSNMCPLPPPGSETGSLTIEHVHEFGRNYEIFDVSYKIDDCVLLRATDTSELRKDRVELGTYPVLAGFHQIQLTTQFRSDFIGQGTGYVWAGRIGSEIEVPANGHLKLIARYYEEPAADPRYRMHTAISVENQAPEAAQN